MYYWNKDNFEGLMDIAEEFKKKDGYELFTGYCELLKKRTEEAGSFDNQEVS